jgi:hypothetical protein
MLKRYLNILIKGLSAVVIISLIGILAAYTYFRFEKQSSVRTYQELPKESSAYINGEMYKLPIINGIQVVKVDLERNVRYIVYAHYTNPQLQDLYATFSKARITLEIPVFTLDDIQNERIVKLMNHEYNCTAYKNTLIYKFVPESSQFIKTICSISIPPAYGEFRGLLAVTLSKEPNDLEKDQVRIFLENVSNKVYPNIK